MTTPAPYPTSGNAIPNGWHCDDVTGGQDCVVTSWQATNETPAPTPTATPSPTSTATSVAYPGGFNASETGYGNWSDDWVNWLSVALLTTAFCLAIAFMFMRWGRKAMR